MAQYTHLNFAQIESVLFEYGFDSLASFEVLTGGSENTNYKLTTDARQFVLTICEKKSLQETTVLADVLKHLKANSFPTSVILATVDGKFVTTVEHKPAVLKEYLEGSIYSEFPPDLLSELGQQIGRLHQIPPLNGLPETIDYGYQNFQQVNDYAPKSPFAAWLKNIANYIQPYIELELPRAMIHSDIFPDNVVVDANDQVVIMDFEEATYYYRMYDLGMAIIGCCCDSERIIPEKLNSLVKGYMQEIELSDVERNSLQAMTVYAGASMCFWRHRNFNFLKPNPELKLHYLGLKKLADSARNLSPTVFQTALH